MNENFLQRNQSSSDAKEFIEIMSNIKKPKKRSVEFQRLSNQKIEK